MAIKIKMTVVSFFFLLLVTTPVLAQQKAFQNPGVDKENTTKSIQPQIFPVPPNYGENPSILGQDHAYSVTFRGNGETVVSAKIVFTNSTDNPLSLLSLRVPKVDPKDVIVFQVLRERQCMQYRPMPINEPQTLEVREKYCAQYQDPDYYGYYGNAKYQKAISLMHGDTLDITLPQPVKANRSGAYIVYYRAFGYAKKNLFGAYPFAFETAKVEDTIRNLTVGISTDSDLFLKGAKGKVNYRFDEAGMMAMKSSQIGAMMESPQFDQYYQQIGYGTITKNASNLQPLDSYIVKGAYADSSLRLYGKEATIAFTMFLFFVGICIYVSKKLFIWLSGPKKSDGKSHNPIPYLTAAGVGFITSCFIVLYSAGLVVFHVILRQLFGYDGLLFFINIFLVMLSLAVYAILLFVPSLAVGYKKGTALGIGTFAATLVFVLFELLAFIIVLFAFSRNGRPPYQILKTMMGRGMMQTNVGKSSEGVPMMEQVEDYTGSTEQLPQ